MRSMQSVRGTPRCRRLGGCSLLRDSREAHRGCFGRGGGRWFTEAGATRLSAEALEEGLRKAACGECESVFWGDLDFAGMQILREIGRTIPATVAWRPGYSKLVALLEAGVCHEPEESAKLGQADPGSTGCEYCDLELLPAMRTSGAFVDQEAACHFDDWSAQRS